MTRIVRIKMQCRKFGKILVSKCDVLLMVIASFTDCCGQKFQMTIFIVSMVLTHRSTVISEE